MDSRFTEFNVLLEADVVSVEENYHLGLWCMDVEKACKRYVEDELFVEALVLCKLKGSRDWFGSLLGEISEVLLLRKDRAAQGEKVRVALEMHN